MVSVYSRALPKKYEKTKEGKGRGLSVVLVLVSGLMHTVIMRQFVLVVVFINVSACTT